MKLSIEHACIALFASGFVVACGPPPYAMQLPSNFKQFENTSDYKLITPDGVMVKAREVENYPEADLAFWVDALKQHLGEQGYALKSEECYTTTAGLAGCTVDFMLPHGAEDWVMSQSLFVVDDEIIVVEAAAPFERYAAVEADLKQALKTFDPEG